jgi:hypothetical protein
MTGLRSAVGGRLRRIDSVFRTATRSFRTLPDFLIVGEAKCGTTSLYDDIVRHPLVREAAVKEVHFFDLRFHRGLDWYRAQFPIQRRARNGGPDHHPIQTGEASPYYMFHPHAMSRIKTALPDVKLIAMLRNPVERAYSQYQHELRHGRETLSFEDAIAREPERLRGERERMLQDERYNSFAHRRQAYLARGIYVDQLRRLRESFDRRQLLVLKSEDYFAAPHATLERVFEFLELPPWQPQWFARRNVGTYAPIDAQLRQRLVDYFVPHNARLYSFLGADLGWS